MKVLVQANRCQGHARCLAEGPDVYVLDDLGFNSTNIDDVPPHLHDQARRGALACPERALTIVEEIAGDSGQTSRITPTVRRENR
jgi:ferredoxin